MYGQMTAGSWIYIGTQGILQGTYETFAAVAAQALRRHARRPARRHRRARRDGRRPAARGHDERRRRAVRRGRPARASSAACRRATSTSAPPTSTRRWQRLDDGRATARRALGRPARQRRRGPPGARPPRRRRSTSSPTRRARTTRSTATCPAGLTRRAGRGAARSDPDELPAPRRRVAGSAHVARDPRAAARGRRGVRLRQRAARPGRSPTATTDAFAYPGFVPAYIRPLFCEGKGPFRWVALSGDPADIHATDAAILDLFGDQEHIARWIPLAQERVALPGPAGADLLAGLRRAPPGRPALQRDGRQRRAEGADRDRPRPPRRRLGRLARARDRGDGATAPTPSPTGRCSTRCVNTACGASWVSIHHGGGVGMGKSIHAGQVVRRRRHAARGRAHRAAC